MWLIALIHAHPTACAIIDIAVAIAGGLALGSVRIRSIGLGSAGVLFVGLLVGQLTLPLNAEVLDFIKEFGLVLFVFTIGLQLGPGFIASLRSDGLRLNLLATAVVLLGSLLAWCAIRYLPIEPAGVLGTLSGAVTNTPSLGATQQALKALPDVVKRVGELPAIAYAVAYPGGIVGIIVSLLLLRWWLRIDPVAEAHAYEQEMTRTHEAFERRTLVVDQPHLDGLTVDRIPGLPTSCITLSRIRSGPQNEVHGVLPTTVLHMGDRVLAVGHRAALDQFQALVGTATAEDLVDAPGRITVAQLVVTASTAIGKHLGALRLGERFGVTVTRIQRSGIDMLPASGQRLHVGDVLHVVGEQDSLKQAARVIGNQLQELNHTHFAPIFAGIAIGVLVGLLPMAMPGLAEPVRLGLAGGPLLVAILLGRLGSCGPLVWYMPEVANRTLRELGIALFLASVGLAAGPAFVQTVFTSTGLIWVALGLVFTVCPLLAVGWFARAVLRMNFIRVCGLLSGSMTDPPALAFATGIAGSEGPATAYAAVYPLTMFLRIIVAQALVVLLCC